METLVPTTCLVQILYIDSIVPAGTLGPTEIRVAVSASNCPGGKVVVRTDHTGQSPATALSATGTAVIDLTVTTPTECDDRILVEAWCDLDPTCKDTKDLLLPCNQCVRAHVSFLAGQCTGNPPVRPVTFTADIGLAAGQSTDFYFDYGDGTSGSPFTITNTTATAKTVYSHVEPPHNYASGAAYPAKLVVIPPPTECGPFAAPITVQCPAVCPVASNAGSADKGCVAVAGQGKKRRIELSVTVTTTPAGATAQWVVRQKLPTGGFGATTFGATFGCPGGPGGQIVGPGMQVPPGPQVFDLDPGDYEATLQFSYPFQTCPGTTLNFTANPCPPDCPTLTLTKPILVTGCAPTNAVATFNATLAWASGQSPVAVSDYFWTVEWLDQSTTPPVQKKAQNSTPGPTLNPSIKTNDPGWYGTGTVGGVVDLSKPGSYTIEVQASIPNVSPTKLCNATTASVPPFQVPPCTCPKPLSSGTEWNVTNTTAPLGPNKFQTLSCDTATAQLSVFVDPGSYSPGDLRYDWSFPDGTTIIGGGSTQQHAFTNATPGTTQTHVVTVSAYIPGSSCAAVTRTVEITVPGCAGPGAPPIVTGCSMTSGASGTGSIRLTFDQDLEQTSAEDPSHYKISINNATPFTPSAGTVSYNSAAKAVTIGGLTIQTGDSVTVTVTGIKATTGAVMATAQANCPPGKKPKPGPTSFCESLLWLSIILMLIGGILVIIGCILTKPAPGVSFWLYVIGGILFGIGFLMFWAWLIWCSSLTSCRVILAARTFVGWLILIAGIIAAVLLLFSITDPTMRLCSGLATAWGLNWALIYWVLNQVATARGCLIENPTGETAGSASSALTASSPSENSMLRTLGSTAPRGSGVLFSAVTRPRTIAGKPCGCGEGK